jgi:hypothetical protein
MHYLVPQERSMFLKSPRDNIDGSDRSGAINVGLSQDDPH